MKYELERLGPDNFEHLVQSLVRGIAGNSVIIFGDGPDGQREAVIENAQFTISNNVATQGRTIVQAKFKSPDTKTNDWDWLRKNLKDELEGFKKKTSTYPHIVPKTFLFFTNIVLTPILDCGTRDRAEKFVSEYKDIIPNIFILGADDIRTMLDNNRDVARSYASFIMPGDVLVELHESLRSINNERFEDLIEYALQMFREDSAVRLEQAGSVSSKSINIRNVYTDLEAKSQSGSGHEINQIAAYIVKLGNRVHKRESTNTDIFGENYQKLQQHVPECNIVLMGNAGQGKSTLCQYICQIYRAALLKRFKPKGPEILSFFAGEEISNLYIPQCERFPVLINLKRYAAWINKQDTESSRSVISYILCLINGKSNASLSSHDFRRLLSGYSWIFMFDGLDEVPSSSNRSEVLKQIQEFLEKDLPESSCDSLVICTSRPQGYDDAFSTHWYNHYELKDMSKPLCEHYIEKLLNYIEDNSEERTRYRRILHSALSDPMVSKLMTTPLYTAIIVLLVKMGGTPPTKRYSLFQEYCDIVVKREMQKELLPSLHDEYDWIIKLHAQIGFILQTESETAENAAAELSTARCKQLIIQFLKDEGFDGELSAKSNDLYLAITNRLSFLSEIPGSDQETCVVFPLRSIQEYFAAEWLISFDNEDRLSEALEIISISGYWRNVYLFVAGFFTKNRNRKNINETLFRICQRNNGDENYESSNTNAYRISMQGSQLALDLLCDNLFSRPVDQRRYLNIAAKLLEMNYDISPLTQKFLRLPSKIADIFLHEKVVPHIQKTKSAEGVAFEFLWIMANNGNSNAITLLDDLVIGVTVPTYSTIRRLLSNGFDKVGVKTIHAMCRWVIQDRFAEFCYPRTLRNDKYWELISQFFEDPYDGELSILAIRQTVYRALHEKCYDRSEFDFVNVSLPDQLLQRILKSDLPKELFRSLNIGDFGLRYQPINHDTSTLSLSKYIEDLQQFQLHELVALIEFLRSPSHIGLKKLLTAYHSLPWIFKNAFINLMKNCNWLLREIADQLSILKTDDELFTHYDSSYVETQLKKDGDIMSFAQVSDFVSITKSNYWNEIKWPYYKTPVQESMQEILRMANEKNIDKGFVSFLYTATEAQKTITPELSQFCLHYFRLLFQNGDGVELAIRLFDEVPISSLLPGNIEYPDTLPILRIYYFDNDNLADRVLEKIDRLAELGKEYLQAYALIPYLFNRVKVESLVKLSPRMLMTYYHAIDATGNQVALLGCILRILTGDVSEEHKNIIWDKLLEILQIDFRALIWYTAAESFSMDGKMLIHEALKTLSVDKKLLSELRDRFAYAILEEIEASPVEKNELMKLSETAHSDQHFS